MSPLAFDTNLVDPDPIVRQDGPRHDLFARWRRDDPVHRNPPPPAGSYAPTPVEMPVRFTPA